ncbi:hypothetical protein F4777DRAFT_579524 [Nemania sp. FL0916]|nr:hypothetical protein F4777DRAFT_579524 [Nemania sp. FL0916]
MDLNEAIKKADLAIARTIDAIELVESLASQAMRSSTCPASFSDADSQEQQDAQNPEDGQNSKNQEHRHIMDRHVGTRCLWPGCHATTANETDLLRHLWDHQAPEINRGTLPTECPWPNCGKSFTRKDTVRRCIKRHNGHAAHEEASADMH